MNSVALLVLAGAQGVSLLDGAASAEAARDIALLARGGAQNVARLAPPAAIETGEIEIPIDEPAPPPMVAAPERTPPRVQILVATLDLVDEAGAALPTQLFCRGAGWVTGPLDTPAHEFVDGRIMAGGSYSSSMFAGSEMFGAMQVSFGQLDLANQASRSLDAWRTYGFDSRKCELFIGYRGEPFPAAFTRVISTEMKRVEVATDRIRVMLRDPMEALKRPLLRNRFAGTSGLEGDAALAGQPRPRAIGTTFFTPMVLVDQARWIYFVCDEPSASSGVVVYDGGAAVTQGAAYSSTADLLSTPPAAGQARVFTAGPTYVRFAAAPGLEPTVTRFGVGGGDTARNLIAELGIAAHPTHRTGPGFGAYVESLSVTYAQVMTEAYRQRPYFFGVDGDRRFVSREVVDPAGETPIVTIGVRDILRISRTTPDGLEVPVWRVVVRGNRNNSKGGTLAASAVAAAHRRFGNASVAETPGTLVKHPTAGELAFEIGGDPVGMASLHLALHGVHRDWFSVVLPLIPQWAHLVEGDVVRIVYHRFDLTAGRNFVVAARTVDFGAGEFIFGLWG